MPDVSVDVASKATEDSRAWVTATLDAVAATLLRLQSDLPEDARMQEVFEAIRPVLYRLCEFEVMGFISMDEDGLGFSVEAIDDWALRPALVGEVEHHVRDGAFAWSLYQNRPVIVRGGPLGQWTVLHSLATPSKVIGMFIAVLPAESPYLPDVAHKALSIVLMSCSSVLESGTLYRRISEHNAKLEDVVAARTAELRRSEAAAHRANRVKSEFLANMSHEMRTPLNGITGMASLLETTRLDDDQQEQVATIVRSSGHLVQLIGDLLDSAKAEAGQLDLEDVWFDLREVLEDVVELLAPKAAEKRVEMVLHYSAGLSHKIRGDPGRVRQVITNLVGNAVKFTTEGQIVVRVAEGETKDGFTISVIDSGIGIEPDNVEHIFDAFAQADSSTTRRFGGTGLGLSIGRTLTRLMGGELHVTSELGVGSTFSFSFEPSEIDHELSVAPVLGGEVVLVVSGRETLTDALGAMVENAGGELTTARRTSDVAPFAEWQSTSWSRRTLIVDCCWDGPIFASLARALRADEDLSTVRLIGLLAPGDRDVGERLEEAGFDQCLTRPVRERRLLAALGGTKSQEKEPDSIAPLAPAMILVADDNPVNVVVARKMIQMLGGEVRTATNGQEAIEALATEDFDVVLMDCQMPVMDGYEATAAIRATGNAVPIIALTAADRVADRERSIAAGMDRHLAKPLTVVALRKALSQWIPERPRSEDVVTQPAEAEPEAPAAGPVFDWAAALERTGGDQEVLGEIAELFIGMWPDLMKGLERASADRDGSQMASIAHRIRGAALNLGAQQIADTACRAEHAWSMSELDGAADCVASLQRGFEDFGTAAERFRPGGTGA